MAEHFLQELSGDSTQVPHKLLSNREYDVMRMLGAGKSFGVIAQELALSVKTMSTYRGRVLLKLGLRNNADLIRYVIEHNLA